MPIVTEFTVLSDKKLTLTKHGAPNAVSLECELPGLAQDRPAFLSFVCFATPPVAVGPNPGFKVEMNLVSHEILRYGFDRKCVTTLHEFVYPMWLNPAKTNRFSFIYFDDIPSGERVLETLPRGRIEIGDVVLWWHRLV